MKEYYFRERLYNKLASYLPSSAEAVRHLCSYRLEVKKSHCNSSCDGSETSHSYILIITQCDTR